LAAQYLLQSENGRVFWFHRNENGTTVFSIITDTPVLQPGKWAHLAVTYDGLRGISQVYVDGKLNKEETADPGVFLSRDWSKYVGKRYESIAIICSFILEIGNHKLQAVYFVARKVYRQCFCCQCTID